MSQSVSPKRSHIERITQLRRLAQSRGVEPSVLARHWLLEQLDKAETGGQDPAADRRERDLRATTEHLRDLLDERPGA